ncbi:transposase [Burkholderia sp. 9773_38]|nr:transposase [Burkholderia sp. 9773_38]
MYESGKVCQAACWDHARRYLDEVHESGSSEFTTPALDMIAKLYGIEAEIRGKPPDGRLRVRQEKGKPLLSCLEAGLSAKFKTLWPEASLGRRDQLHAQPLGDAPAVL